MAEEIPEFIAKYKVKEKIAQGGMGTVYKAIHPSLKREVVIKKMTIKSNAIVREQFKKEAQILLDMQSPYIVHLFDYFTEGPYRYMVEEFVDGMALDNLIKKQTIINPLVALLILQDCCFALKFAHKKGIIHRDIKPGNILISRKAEIKLADFGIATDEKDNDDKNQEKITVGTPAYMPPEQFENSATVDCRADIYALGVMLYEMVTGTKPFLSEYSKENIAKIKRGKFIKLKKIDKTIPAVICKLVKKMIRPKAKSRFSSVDSILKIIKKYLKNYDVRAIKVELAKCVLSKTSYKVADFQKRKNPWKTGVLIFLSSCFLVSGIFYLWTQGFIHRYLLRAIYTPVVLSMKMPEVSSPASQISALAVFFKLDKNLEQIENSERVFEKGTVLKNATIKKDNEQNNKNYVTNPIYLKPGDYRVKVVIGSSVWWKSFSVDKNDKIIRIDNFNQQQRIISSNFCAFDSKTGIDITDKTNFYILYKGKWTLFEKVPKEKLLSSNVWKFRAESDGYIAEEFSLLIDWYQDTVFCNFDLVPKN